MSKVSASLTIQVTPSQAEEPFALVVDSNDQSGSAPVRIAFGMRNIVIQPGMFVTVPEGLPDPLTIQEKGKKRIKLFCSNVVDPTVKMFTDEGGSVSRIGRRAEPITETLSWMREKQKQVQYFYDSPTVEVISKTPFRNAKGVVVDPPLYDRGRAEFRSPTDVIGAMVVRYSPGFTLYEVEYDTGKTVSSPAHFKEIETAWQAGDIYAADIPPVRVTALSDWHAQISTFERKIWPPQAPTVRWAMSGDKPSESTNQFQESAGTRKTVTERIYHPEDPEVYLDVEKTVYIEAVDSETGQRLRLRLLDS